MFFPFYCIFFILLLKLRIYEPFIYLYIFVKIIKVFLKKFSFQTMMSFYFKSILLIIKTCFYLNKNEKKMIRK